MPRVTVLLPVFNGARYLKGALGSVLAQSYKDFELLVIDDGSTDQTPAIVTSFHDMRIKYLRHNKNEGLIASLNEGIAWMQTIYATRAGFHFKPSSLITIRMLAWLGLP
jgi:glycosyltransferase involved in cell wall biosynthesis